MDKFAIRGPYSKADPPAIGTMIDAAIKVAPIKPVNILLFLNGILFVMIMKLRPKKKKKKTASSYASNRLSDF
jgi:hypothetical protein